MITFQDLTTFGAITLLSACIAGWFGFHFRSRQLRKFKRRIEELEEEMLTSHREVLQLETELAKRLTASLHSAPVIPFSNTNQKAAK
jgi:hypothetical protein